MIEVKAEQKKFRVRLTEKELSALLQATDVYCRQLVKQHILSEKARENFLKQCNFDSNQTPELALKWKLMLEEDSSIDAKLRSLESVEAEFEALLSGKRRGRRPKTAFNREHLWNVSVLNEARDQIRNEKFIEKLLKEAESTGRTAQASSS